MAKIKQQDRQSIVKVEKRTCQGGRAKTSSMNKGKRRSYKKYRGQGK